ncbi:MAG: pilin, type IV [Bryobacterales bacterium]|nr:pilin, type IV [Bryobacterales bacterium]
MIAVAVILIMVSAAIPYFSKIPKQSRESAAIRTMQTIHTAQTQYYSQFGRYAASLMELGPPAAQQEGPASAGLIPEDLARGEKGGYLFRLDASPQGYTLVAVPAVPGNTGRRSFYSDQTSVIREQWGGEPATRESRTI